MSLRKLLKGILIISPWLLRSTLAKIHKVSKQKRVLKTLKQAKAVKSVLENYSEAAKKDFVSSLPGADREYTTGFRQFSGYFTVDDNHQRKIHYWYIESFRDPDNDPVVLWTNGGPGCSGLYGLGAEFGPFLFQADGTLIPNPFTWNSIANIIYIEQPVGTGFSYSLRPEVDYAATGDTQSKLDNFRVIQEFFKRYPERIKNDFYIASESYGGHYIPQLAIEILDRNTQGVINFRGLLVGNPYVEPSSNFISRWQTFYFHGILSKIRFEQVISACADPSYYYQYMEPCTSVMEELWMEIGNKINPYALEFPVCVDSDKMTGSQPFQHFTQKSSKSTDRSLSFSSQSKRLLNLTMPSTRENRPRFLSNAYSYSPCAEKYLTTYLNRVDVKQALHVNVSIPWAVCSGEIWNNYPLDDYLNPQIDLFKEVIRRAKDIGSNLKILVYSGDDDAVCPLAGTQDWIYDIGASPKEDELWKSWFWNQQVAGYVTKFDLGISNSSFIFATVHGAGHEVPSYRPAEALSLFESFFTEKWNVD